jgi:hypothetical protein
MANVVRREKVLDPATLGTGAAVLDGAAGWLRLPILFGDFPRLRANVAPFESSIKGRPRRSSMPQIGEFSQAFRRPERRTPQQLLGS